MNEQMTTELRAALQELVHKASIALPHVPQDGLHDLLACAILQARAVLDRDAAKDTQEPRLVTASTPVPPSAADTATTAAQERERFLRSCVEKGAGLINREARELIALLDARATRPALDPAAIERAVLELRNAELRHAAAAKKARRARKRADRAAMALHLALAGEVAE